VQKRHLCTLSGHVAGRRQNKPCGQYAALFVFIVLNFQSLLIKAIFFIFWRFIKMLSRDDEFNLDSTVTVPVDCYMTFSQIDYLFWKYFGCLKKSELAFMY
jgi:hypothetical protein